MWTFNEVLDITLEYKINIVGESIYILTRQIKKVLLKVALLWLSLPFIYCCLEDYVAYTEHDIDHQKKNKNSLHVNRKANPH